MSTAAPATLRPLRSTGRAGSSAGIASRSTAARAEPAFTALLAERDRRFADRVTAKALPLEFHREALVAVGFEESGGVWRLHDDPVLRAIG